MRSCAISVNYLELLPNLVFLPLARTTIAPEAVTRLLREFPRARVSLVRPCMPGDGNGKAAAVIGMR